MFISTVLMGIIHELYFGTDTQITDIVTWVLILGLFMTPPFKLKNDPLKVVKYVIDSIGSLSFIVLYIIIFHY